MTTKKNCRSRSIEFKQPISGNDLEKIKASLRNFTSIVDTDITAKRMTFSYEFPELSLNTIWESILHSADKLELSFLQKLKIETLCYMEENERDHLCSTPRWQLSSRSIYAYYYDKRHRTKLDSHKKQWKKYSK